MFISSEMLFSLFLYKREIVEITRFFFPFYLNYFAGCDKEVSVVSWIELGHSNMQSESKSARYFNFDLYCPEYWS